MAFLPFQQRPQSLGDFIRTPQGQALLTQLGASLLSGRSLGQAIGDAGSALSRLQQQQLQQQLAQLQAQRAMEDVLSSQAQRNTARERLGLEKTRTEADIANSRERLNIAKKELDLRINALKQQAAAAAQKGNVVEASDLLKQIVDLQKARESEFADLALVNPEAERPSIQQTAQDVFGVLGSIIRGLPPQSVIPQQSQIPLQNNLPLTAGNTPTTLNSGRAVPDLVAQPDANRSPSSPPRGSPAASTKSFFGLLSQPNLFSGGKGSKKRPKAEKLGKSIQKAEIAGAAAATARRIAAARGSEGVRRALANIDKFELSDEAKKAFAQELQRLLKEADPLEQARRIGTRPGVL